jgi:hypothetical protein
MNDLLKEAIADAKAVRETALANAKVALEEAFTPRLQSMLSAKISEDDEKMEEEAEEPIEAGDGGMDAAAGAPVSETDDVEEGEHSDMEEGMHGDDDKNEGMHGDDVEEGEHSDMDETDDMDEDLELEAIIKELEEDLEEELDSSDIGSGTGVSDDASSTHTEDPGEGELTAEGEDDKVEETDDKKVDEDITLDEIIAALKEEEGDKMEEEDKDDVKETDKKDLEEAYNVIKFLKSKINEVNLLNAKLLFSNKLFRNYPLSESQKMKVIENFDRASNLREVKLIYSTLCESFTVSKTKRSIKESYASKPSMSTAPKKEIISESNALTARWKKLANLK